VLSDREKTAARYAVQLALYNGNVGAVDDADGRLASQFYDVFKSEEREQVRRIARRRMADAS
jgi:hypothetical protein